MRILALIAGTLATAAILAPIALGYRAARQGALPTLPQTPESSR